MKGHFNVHQIISRVLSPLLFTATRESAFVHAIASAGVAFAVTRSCAEGTSTICGCDSHHKGPPGEGWKWGGCSEDADFGVLVSREFADARENRPDARSAMNRHNNEAGRTVSDFPLYTPLKRHRMKRVLPLFSACVNVISMERIFHSLKNIF